MDEGKGGSVLEGELVTSVVEVESFPQRSLPGKVDEVEYVGGFRVTVMRQGKASLAPLCVLMLHDIGMNSVRCFETFTNYCRSNPRECPQFLALPLLFLDAPGHEDGAEPIAEVDPWPKMDSFNKTLEVIRSRFELKRVIGFGVGAGATVLLHHALSSPSMYTGLVLVSPSIGAPGYVEHIRLRAAIYYMWYSGVMTEWMRTWFLQRWFTPDTIEFNHPLREKFLEVLETTPSMNIARYASAYINRPNIAGLLQELPRSIRILVVAGRDSVIYEDILDHMLELGPGRSTLAEYMDVGALVLEEKPAECAETISLFFQGLGII
mmetsp:Transcript_11134/g.22173  ORF Transcript_11134/g.22173 Transcript_11134/m.22173 type:complete len:322 (-) Transcript_11134:158-1123(-)